MELNISDFIDVLSKALDSGEKFVLPLKGTSMLPFFKTGDKAILTRPKKLSKYDVIFYTRGENYILHRIVKKKEDYYLVTGDNQTALEKVRDKQIHAVMQSYIVDGKIKNINFWYRFKVMLWCIIPFRKACLKVTRKLTKYRR